MAKNKKAKRKTRRCSTVFGSAAGERQCKNRATKKISGFWFCSICGYEVKAIEQIRASRKG